MELSRVNEDPLAIDRKTVLVPFNQLGQPIIASSGQSAISRADQKRKQGNNKDSEAEKHNAAIK